MSHIRGRIVSVAATVAISAAMLFSMAVPRARADDDCQKRIEHIDHLLHIAIHNHGPDSPDAQRRRQELHEAREQCWRENHRWWDPDQHRWHDQQDWDDHDHDH